ncbi:MAG TPA: extracellular solute-binding protein [Ruminiclostridium sp.]
MKAKRILATITAITLMVTITACGNTTKTPTDTQSTAAETSVTSKAVTLKMFSNVPDRTTGLGLLEETNLISFKAANPNVTIETEFLQDEPYKMKLQTYMQSGNMPDLWMQWGSPALLGPIVNGNYAVVLNPDDYKDYNFVAGALDGFTVDGKLYGLPKNADFWLMYYNEKILADNGIEIPKTTDDYIAAAAKLKAKGIACVSLAGKDKWPTGLILQNLIVRQTGDPLVFTNAVKTGTTSGNADIDAAIIELIRLIDNGVFQPSYNADDYGTAKNLFIQGKAAMFVMGSWEMGMAADQTIPEEVRSHIRATKFPVIKGAKGTENDIAMWYGGGYSVSDKSAVKDTAIKLLNHLLSPENYAKNAWQKQIVIPPMKYDQYLTGSENALQKDLTKIMTEATASTGDEYSNYFNPSFKNDSENLMLELGGKLVDSKEFTKRLDAYAKEAIGK